MSERPSDSSGAARVGGRARPPAFTPVNGTRRHAEEASADLLAAVLGGCDLHYVVPLLLDRVEMDPLASAGWFSGDLLRGLLEVPASFWARQPRLYARFRESLRAGAIARRGLPADERAHFWTAVLPVPERRSAHAADDHGDVTPSGEG